VGKDIKRTCNVYCEFINFAWRRFM